MRIRELLGPVLERGADLVRAVRNGPVSVQGTGTDVRVVVRATVARSLAYAVVLLLFVGLGWLYWSDDPYDNGVVTVGGIVFTGIYASFVRSRHEFSRDQITIQRLFRRSQVTLAGCPVVFIRKDGMLLILTPGTRRELARIPHDLAPSLEVATVLEKSFGWVTERAE